MEFKAFPKIDQIGKVNMQITQKIHGTNAQVFIIQDPDFEPKDQAEIDKVNSDLSSNLVWHDGKLHEFQVGSRTRWIVPGNDNYGFAAHVYKNKVEFIAKLGVGQHFGEWAGPGINSGEGLTEKMFVLFDFWRYPAERPLPPQTTVVPVLYKGAMDLKAIETVMADLKETGSKLAPGFMRPEGVVVMAMGTRYKKVFQNEEAAWKQPDQKYRKDKEAEKTILMDTYGHLLQPMRLEKLLSRDEEYVSLYPNSLNRIVEDYWNDLVAEGQVSHLLEVKKAVSPLIFKFVRTVIDDHKESLRMEDIWLKHAANFGKYE